jgi:hypothetical protein
LFPRNRIATLWHAVDDHLRRATDRREDQHVKLRAKIRRVANHVIGNVRVRNLILVELDPVPAFVLSVSPGMNDRDTWHCHLVSFDVRQFVHTNGLETELSDRGLQTRAQIRRIAILLQDKRACIELLIADLERIFCRTHLHVFQPEAKGRESIVGVVIDEVCDR